MGSPYNSYHEGELAVQTRAGIGSEGLAADAMYRPVLPSGVQRFLASQQLAVLSTKDAADLVWASMRSGPPGFLRALDERMLEIGGYSHPDDPLTANLGTHSEAGMIVIRLETRHRVRLNGVARAQSDGKIVLRTQQVYGNCPQYIQARTVVGDREVSASRARFGTELDEQQCNRYNEPTPCSSRRLTRRRAPMLLIEAEGRGLFAWKARRGCCSLTTRATTCSTLLAISFQIPEPGCSFQTSPREAHCCFQETHASCGTTRE